MICLIYPDKEITFDKLGIFPIKTIIFHNQQSQNLKI